MNVFNIENAFKQKAERGWHTLYVMVDAHGTMIKPGHDKIIFYDGAVEILKWFCFRKDFKLILWTSSHPKEVEAILAACKEHDINFAYVNENPQEQNSNRANFDRKFYFNIILDDKAGFEPEIDWGLIKGELERIGQWDNDNSTIMAETLKKPTVKQRAIYIEKLPQDSPNFLGYGTTGFVTSAPVNNFVYFSADGGRDYLIDLKNLYFPNDVD